MSILRFGLLLATASSLFACQGQSASEVLAGKDIKSYVNTDGTYAVTCKTGLVETVTEVQILTNQICKTGNFMQVSGPVFVMSADGATDNCLIQAAEENVRTIYLEAAPKKVGEDTGILVGASNWPKGIYCGVSEGVILKEDVANIRFGFSDGETIKWSDEEN